MAKENLDKEDGVWRTVGGRRIFIRNGQSLSDAMIESGKFKGQKNKKGARESYREEIPKIEDERKEAKSEEQRLKRERESLINRYSNAKRDIDREYYGEGINNATKWIGEEKEKVENYDAMLDKEGQKASKERQKEFDKEHGKAEQLREEYLKNPENEATKEREKNLKKVEKSLEEEEQFDKESLEDWTRYRDRYQQSLNRASNPDSKRRFREERDEAQREIDKIKAKMGEKETKTNEEVNKYQATKREGFGSYNDDNIPVYDNKIDYTGDFTNADLSKLSDEELKEALNKQSELYKEATNEELGDQRTRNGRMNKIFNTAKVQKYEGGMQKINEEMQKRDLPRYNIYDEESGQIMVSSPTKEMADRQLKEMYETDKQLQKDYGWEKLPKYSIKEGKVDEYLNERNDNKSTNETMNNAIREKASKKSSKFEPDLPKHTEIKSQGTSNRKEVSENIQAHILDHYDSPEDFIEQMDAYDWKPTNWHRGEALAEDGFYEVYYDDQRKFLDDLKINPKGKDFDDDRVFQTYKSLIGRESAKLYDRIKKNQYNEYKKQHPLTTMSFEDFKNKDKK